MVPLCSHLFFSQPHVTNSLTAETIMSMTADRLLPSNAGERAMCDPTIMASCFAGLIAFEFAVMSMSVSAAIAVAMAACAAITDISRHKIYNWVTYPAIGLGLLLPAVTSMLQLTGMLGAMTNSLSDVSLLSSVAGLLVCGTAMLATYALSGGGAGDVKYAAALGALLGLHSGIAAIMIAYIVAALWIVGRIVGQTLIRKLRGQVIGPRFSGRLDGVIPMGGFFAVGVTLVLSGAI